MRYVLIANNPNIIEFNFIQKCDNIIVFNYNIHVNKIYNYINNITWICRINQKFLRSPNIDIESYAGINLINKYNNLMKICFYNSPKYLSDNIKEICNKQICNTKISMNKILEIDKDVETLKKDISYPRYKNMSTGLLYYNYLQRVDPGCKIVLVGFTSDVNKSYHHASWERVFFQKQYDSGKCEMIW